MSETRVVHVNDKIEGAVYIGRTMPARGKQPRREESFWANTFKIGAPVYGTNMVMTRADVIEAYQLKVTSELTNCLGRLPELRGKPLACWCRHDGEARTPENACHGDVLVELLDRYSDDELRAMGGVA